MAPKWEYAVRIYLQVLENDNASAEGKQIAREDIIFLAKTVDQLSKAQEAEQEQNG